MYNYSNINNSILAINNENISINNISISNSGMNFELVIGDERKNIVTSLIGIHFIEDILLAVTLAYNLGMSIQDIARGIMLVEAIPHRFEVSINDGVTIIDDSYNANIVGAKHAIDTLSCFEGRKIVATQGIVEGGKSEKALNVELGKYMAQKIDIVVLIGSRGKYINNGLLSGNFNKQSIISVRTLADAERIFSALLKPHDNLLIMNDLPDNY